MSPLSPARLHTLGVVASLGLANWDKGGWPQGDFMQLSQGLTGGLRMLRMKAR